MSEVITLRRSILRIGMLGLPFYLAMLIISVLAFYFDCSPERGAYAALFAAAVWWLAIGGSLYLIICYFKESVTLYEESVYVQHILGARTIALGEVLRARWCWRKGHGYLRLFLRDGRERFWLSNYPPQRCRRLIAFFRERLPLPVQEGWNEDLQRYAEQVGIKESPEEVKKFLQSLWRPAIAGPISGFLCGLVLHLCEVYFDVTAIPKWSGSLMVDWTGIGVLIGLVILVGMWLLGWVFWPEQ